MRDQIKVLIVDDKVNIRTTFRNLLYQYDCDFREAESGEEAFGKISKEYFDVVFFDNKLPGDDGIEIIRKIREFKLSVGPIFFMTGYPEENTKREADELKVFCFINKDKMNFREIVELFGKATNPTYRTSIRNLKTP